MTKLLKLDPDPTFVAPAYISVPGGEPVEVAITWRYKSRTDYAAWLSGPSDRTDAAALSEVICGWGPEIDLPYSVDALEKLLDIYPSAAGDLILAYRKALFEGRRKN